MKHTIGNVSTSYIIRLILDVVDIYITTGEENLILVQR